MKVKVVEAWECEVVKEWEGEISSLAELDELLAEYQERYEDANVYYSGNGRICIEWED